MSYFTTITLVPSGKSRLILIPMLKFNMYSSLFAMRMLQVIDPYGADLRMRLGIEMAVDFIFAEFWFVYFHRFLFRRKEV